MGNTVEVRSSEVWYIADSDTSRGTIFLKSRSLVFELFPSTNFASSNSCSQLKVNFV